MSGQTIKAKYSIDNEIYEVTGTRSACYIQLDVLLTIYGGRFKFMGSEEVSDSTGE